MPHLVDTDILIDFFHRHPAAAEYLDAIKDWSYSVATAMELLAGANDKKQLREIEKFLAGYRQVPLSEELGTNALGIIKSYSKADGLDPVDALLAATAMAGDLTLSTRNAKHLVRVPVCP